MLTTTVTEYMLMNTAVFINSYTVKYATINDSSYDLLAILWPWCPDLLLSTMSHYGWLLSWYSTNTSSFCSMGHVIKTVPEKGDVSVIRSSLLTWKVIEWYINDVGSWWKKWNKGSIALFLFLFFNFYFYFLFFFWLKPWYQHIPFIIARIYSIR